jgi:hypothetical protein
MRSSSINIAILALALVSASPLYAANNVINKATDPVLTDINIHNNTSKDIAYWVRTDNADANIYALRCGKKGVYHVRRGDNKATFETGTCKSINRLTGNCSGLEPASVKNCVGNAYYDPYKVRNLTINAVNTCEVTCLDGSNSSCIVSGVPVISKPKNL